MISRQTEVEEGDLSNVESHSIKSSFFKRQSETTVYNKELIIKKIILFLFLAMSSTNIMAKVYVEADPMAYGLGGYSLHVGVENYGFRFQVGTFSAEYPDAFKQNEDFDVKQSGYGLKLDYYGSSPEGAFIGVEYGKTTIDYSLSSSSQTIERDANLLGVRIGYKWIIGRHIYITPWVGIDKNLSDTSDVNSAGETYEVSEWLIFPTVHFGMEF